MFLEKFQILRNNEFLAVSLKLSNLYLYPFSDRCITQVSLSPASIVRIISNLRQHSKCLAAYRDSCEISLNPSTILVAPQSRFLQPASASVGQ